MAERFTVWLDAEHGWRPSTICRYRSIVRLLARDLIAGRRAVTWQYVNKNGGPDRRFNNNRQLPIMLYGEVELTTPTGLRWMLQLSRPDVASVMAAALRAHPSLRAGER